MKPKGRKPGPVHRSPPGGLRDPNHCLLPVRGGFCPEHLLTETNRDGELRLYCRIHGERPALVYRPAQFVRYDQRQRLEAELRAKVGRAETIQPATSGSLRRKRMDLTVVGSALAWKLGGL